MYKKMRLYIWRTGRNYTDLIYFIITEVRQIIMMANINQGHAQFDDILHNNAVVEDEEGNNYDDDDDGDDDDDVNLVLGRLRNEEENVRENGIS